MNDLYTCQEAPRRIFCVLWHDLSVAQLSYCMPTMVTTVCARGVHYAIKQYPSARADRSTTERFRTVVSCPCAHDVRAVGEGGGHGQSHPDSDVCTPACLPVLILIKPVLRFHP